MTPRNAESTVYERPSRAGADWLFVREAIRDWRSIGAVAPSSAALAEALTAPLRGRRRSEPLRVLEVGAGTGVVTAAILDRVPPASRVDVVEANRRFAPGLRHLAVSANHARVAVHSDVIEETSLTGTYDFITSGLPMTNFSVELATQIMQSLLGLLARDGKMTYFAYRGTGLARRVVGSRSQARRHHSIEALMRRYHAEYHASAAHVWANIPPARVWTLRHLRPTPDA